MIPAIAFHYNSTEVLLLNSGKSGLGPLGWGTVPSRARFHSLIKCHPSRL